MSFESETSIKTRSAFEKLIDNLKNNPHYKKEIFLNRLIGFYRIGSEIGTGNFSQVKLGLHLLTKEKVAIKILDKTKLDAKTQRLLLREISSMQRLHHPNIIRLYEVIHTPERLFICMEYAPDGELYTRITNEGRIKEPEGRIVFSQIISAIDHMHSHNVIHRDIKAENIFFYNSNPTIVKIGDFGFSIEASRDKPLNTYCGSPPYAAPELFRDDNYIGIYVDIWALGVLLYFIVTGLMPFKAETVSKLKRVILNGDFIIPSFVSDSCQLLIRGVLRPVPADRFNIKEIMESAWLDGEKFTLQLEPYQLNPILDRGEIKEEEKYTIKVLESLGITEEYLIYSNIKDNNGYYNGTNFQNQHHHNQNTLMNNLISAKSLNTIITSPTRFNGIQYKNYQQLLTPEVKQSINGTYRIIFHSIQKKMRNEYSSEQMNEARIAYKYNEYKNGSNSYSNNNNTTINGHYHNTNSNNYNSDLESASSTVNLYQNDTKSRKLAKRSNDVDAEEEGEDEFDHNNNWVATANKTGKPSIDSSNSIPPNSIFVRLNSQNNNNNVNSNIPINNNVNGNSIFVKYNANTKATNSASSESSRNRANTNGIQPHSPQSVNSKEYNPPSNPSSQNSAVYQINRSSKNNTDTLKESSSQNKINKDKPNNLSQSNKNNTAPNQNNIKPSIMKQSSKLCTIL